MRHAVSMGTSPQRAAPGYVGLTEEQARLRADEEGVPLRVVHRDGEDFMVTADYVERRVNVAVRDGIVFDARRG